METRTKSLNTRVWLEGDPVYSLTYFDVSGREIRTDITGYRPDPSQYLSEDRKYAATIIFESEYDYQGKERWVLRSMSVKSGQSSDLRYDTIASQRFVYIR